MTVPINAVVQQKPLTVDPLVQEVLERRTPNDYRNRRKRLEYILRGRIQESPRDNYSYTPGKERSRVIILTQHTIQIAIQKATERILEPGQYDSMPPFYYRLILEYAHKCLEKGMGYVDGLPCHWTNCPDSGIIKENTRALSMAKRHGSKYYHIYCGHRLNLL